MGALIGSSPGNYGLIGRLVRWLSRETPSLPGLCQLTTHRACLAWFTRRPGLRVCGTNLGVAKNERARPAIGMPPNMFPPPPAPSAGAWLRPTRASEVALGAKAAAH